MEAAEKAMTYSVKLAPADRHRLLALAQAECRKPSDTVRLLIRQAFERIEQQPVHGLGGSLGRQEVGCE